MSKTHFVEIAKILAGEYATTSTLARAAEVDSIARALADLFVAENPRFDRMRSYTAVGIGMSPDLTQTGRN